MVAMYEAAKFAFDNGVGVHGDRPLPGVKNSIPVLRAKTDGGSFRSYAIDKYPDFNPLIACRIAMLESFACYSETPFYRSQENTKVQQYTKEVVTFNAGATADWLGQDEEAIAQQFARRFEQDEDSLAEGDVSHLRFSTSKVKGNTVVQARKPFSVNTAGTRIIPLPVLQVYVGLLHAKMQKELVRVTFQKDNGDRRIIDTTLNRGILTDIYGDDQFVDNMLGPSYAGDFFGNPSLLRGYIRVPEVGASIYDTGTRSINYGRIESVEFGVDPQTEFIRISVAEAPHAFEAHLLRLESRSVDLRPVRDLLKANGFTPVELEGAQRVYASELTDWASRSSRLAGTLFDRELALFMLMNPLYFEGYTGEPMQAQISSNSIGLE